MGARPQGMQRPDGVANGQRPAGASAQRPQGKSATAAGTSQGNKAFAGRNSGNANGSGFNRGNGNTATAANGNTGIAGNGNGNTGVAGNNVGSGNVNTGDVVAGNNVNVDVDNGWGGWNGYPAGAYATGVAVGATATAATVGTYYSSLPATCTPYPWNSINYYTCGGAWYVPEYRGSSVVYVTVANPTK
jgi:hypothetical protein